MSFVSQTLIETFRLNVICLSNLTGLSDELWESDALFVRGMVLCRTNQTRGSEGLIVKIPYKVHLLRGTLLYDAAALHFTPHPSLRVLWEGPGGGGRRVVGMSSEPDSSFGFDPSATKIKRSVVFTNNYSFPLELRGATVDHPAFFVRLKAGAIANVKEAWPPLEVVFDIMASDTL